VHLVQYKSFSVQKKGVNAHTCDYMQLCHVLKKNGKGVDFILVQCEISCLEHNLSGLKNNSSETVVFFLRPLRLSVITFQNLQI
jgi:hypothetical protein